MTFTPNSILVVGDDMTDGTGVVTAGLRLAGLEANDLTLAPVRQLPSNVVEACRHSLQGAVLLLGGAARNAAAVADALHGAGHEMRPPTLIAVLEPVDGSLRTALLEAGVEEVLVAPVSDGELAIRCRNLLRMRRLLASAEARADALEMRNEQTSRRLEEAISALRAAERRLERKMSAREAETQVASELLTDAAHELRAPLNGILGFSQLIAEQLHGPVGDARYLDYAREVQEAGKRLLAIVDGTLDLARVSSGDDLLDVRPIDIGRAVKETERALSAQARSGGVRLEVIVPESPLIIQSDPDKVRQIVLNLAGNAIKFTPRGGKVTVEVRADENAGAAILVFRDTGQGIAPQDMATALRPFGQIHQTDRAHPGGAGLGLPLTRRYVEMLGGRLEIESLPGEGTVVTVRLPPASPVENREGAAAVGR